MRPFKISCHVSNDRGVPALCNIWHMSNIKSKRHFSKLTVSLVGHVRNCCVMACTASAYTLATSSSRNCVALDLRNATYQSHSLINSSVSHAECVKSVCHSCWIFSSGHSPRSARIFNLVSKSGIDLALLLEASSARWITLSSI